MTTEEEETQERRAWLFKKLRKPLPCVEIIACENHERAGRHLKTHAPKTVSWGSRNQMLIDGWRCDPSSANAQLHYTCPLCGCLAVIRYARHVGPVSCCGESITQHEVFLVPR